MMKNKRKISDLFYDNRFLFIFSLVVAIGFWLVASVEFSTETTRTISNVDVQIDYSKAKENFNLEPFGETKFTVDVVVSGKKYVVEADDIEDDIVVKTVTYVNKSGKQKLKLEVDSKSDRPAYEIVGIYENNVPVNEIEVYFDYFKSTDFEIVPEIDKTVAEGYHLGEYVYPESKRISVSGPESQVNAIEKVIATAKIDEPLTENTTVDAELSTISKTGSALEYLEFGNSSKTVQITLPVYKIETFAVDCTFVNKPTDYIAEFPFEYKIEPATALFGVPESKLESIATISVKDIEFWELVSGENVFTVNVSDLPPDIVVLDDTEEFTITVDMGDVVTKTIEVSDNVTFNHVPNGAKAELSTLGFKEITVCGPRESVNKITKENMVLVAELKDVNESVRDEVSVPVSLVSSDCWSCGTYYASVIIS